MNNTEPGRGQIYELPSANSQGSLNGDTYASKVITSLSEHVRYLWYSICNSVMSSLFIMEWLSYHYLFAGFGCNYISINK
jgi:hypothetical protein